jgi:hypothetical protein
VCILGGFYVIDTKLQLRGRPFVGSQKRLTTKMATANESLMGAKLEGAGKNKNTRSLPTRFALLVPFIILKKTSEYEGHKGKRDNNQQQDAFTHSKSVSLRTATFERRGKEVHDAFVPIYSGNLGDFTSLRGM